MGTRTIEKQGGPHNGSRGGRKEAVSTVRELRRTKWPAHLSQRTTVLEVSQRLQLSPTPISPAPPQAAAHRRWCHPWAPTICKNTRFYELLSARFMGVMDDQRFLIFSSWGVNTVRSWPPLAVSPGRKTHGERHPIPGLRALPSIPHLPQ